MDFNNVSLQQLQKGIGINDFDLYLLRNYAQTGKLDGRHKKRLIEKGYLIENEKTVELSTFVQMIISLRKTNATRKTTKKPKHKRRQRTEKWRD